MLFEESNGKKRTKVGDIAVEKLPSGFLVENPILSLDSQDEALFNFCSSINSLFSQPASQFPKKQTLLSQEAFDYLKWRGIAGNFLPCPYFRSVSLGGLTVELLPSGMGCGSSFLRIEKGSESILYAQQWSLRESAALRAASPKKSDVLILDLKTDPSTHSHITDKREVTRFVEMAKNISQTGEWVIAVAPSFGPAQTLLNSLQAQGVQTFVDAQGFKMVQSLRVDLPDSNMESWISKTKKISAGALEKTAGVILLSKEQLRSLKQANFPDGVWLWLGDDFEELVHSRPPWMNQIQFSDVFSMSFQPDNSEVLDLASMVKPEKVILSGEGADSIDAVLKRQKYKVERHERILDTLF